jgi:hypothetical protein
MKTLEFVVLIVLTVLIAFAIALWVPGNPMDKLKLAITYGGLIMIFLFGFMVLAAMASGRIDLSQLLEEKGTGGASMGRFQLLIFTFVIGMSFFLVVLCGCKMPDIPTNVLALLGVSATTYGVGKGIQAASNDANTTTQGNREPPPDPVNPPPPR